MSAPPDALAHLTDGEVERFRIAHGSFAAAAEKACMPVIFTDDGNDELTVVFANTAFLHLVDRPRRAILGQSLENFLAATFDNQDYGALQAALAAGREGAWKLPCRSADGEEIWTSVFACPVRDHRGNQTHNFLSFVRLDENGEGFVEGRDELAALYDEAPGFIAIAEGPHHLFTFANAAYKRFVNNPDLVGRTVTEALPSLASQGFIDLLDRVFETGVAYVGNDVEIAFNDPATGSVTRRYCDFVYQPIRSADGSVKGLFCEGYDVTEKHLVAKKMAELQHEVIQLSRVNAMGTMAATLAHELNQPLTAIGNYTEAGRLYLSRHGEAGIAQATEALDAIGQLTRQTGALIRNLRDLTAHRTGHWSEFDLRIAIAECIRLVEAAAADPVAIIDATSEPIPVHADRIQIQQVLINLLKNACESGDGTRPLQVEIRARRTAGEICVCVVDNGTGVRLDAAKSLFTLNETTKDHGMGIGLSVSRTIIEGHGGRIWLEDTSCAGSEFCLTLPVAPNEEHAGEIPDRLL